MDALNGLSLPPGFGFHPTDVELISHYLKKKVNGLKIDHDVISEIDIYKHEPWDLPSKCKVPTKDTKWHFFNCRDRKYPNGSRSNRATEAGYWKSTGKDRNIKIKNKIIGTKKTLVFHAGRPPSGKRTDWIMHEYYLDENECKNAPDVKDLFVLCRVTKRDGFGPEADTWDPQEVKIETEQSIGVISEPVMSDNLSIPSQNNNNIINNVNNIIINNVDNNNDDDGDLDNWFQELCYDPNAFPILDDSALLVGPTQTAPKSEPLYFSPGEGSEDENNPYLLQEDLHTILGTYNNFENTENLQFLDNETDFGNFENSTQSLHFVASETVFGNYEDNETGILIRQRDNTRYNNNPNEMPNVSKYNVNCKLQVKGGSNQTVQFSPKGGWVGEFDNSEKGKGENVNAYKYVSSKRGLFGFNPLMVGALIIGGIGIMICYALSKSDVTSSLAL